MAAALAVRLGAFGEGFVVVVAGTEILEEIVKIIGVIVLRVVVFCVTRVSGMASRLQRGV